MTRVILVNPDQGVYIQIPGTKITRCSALSEIPIMYKTKTINNASSQRKQHHKMMSSLRSSLS